MELEEGGKRKENDRTSTILQIITSMKIEDIRMYIESC
jgi:hypothetical protein